jgi:hypothetical protein
VDAVSAEVVLTVGARLDVPADSVVKVNFDDGTENNIAGWVPSFTPVGPDLSGSVSVSASVGPRIQLEVALGFFGLEAGVGLALSAPTLGLTLGAEADTAGGVCDNPDAQLGVNVDVGLLAQLDAFGGVGDLKDLPNRFGLVSISTELFATCITIGGSAPSDAAAVPVDAPAATTTADLSATPTDAALTGSVTSYNFSLSEDCPFPPIESTAFVVGECTQFITTGTLSSVSVGFAFFNAEESNCILEYFSDDACTTRVGPASQPSSDRCTGKSDLGDDGDTVKFMLVECF